MDRRPAAAGGGRAGGGMKRTAASVVDNGTTISQPDATSLSTPGTDRMCVALPTGPLQVSSTQTIEYCRI